LAVAEAPPAAAGPQAAALVHSLGKPFDLVAAAPGEGRAWAQTQLRNNTSGADVAVITGSGPTQVLIDGSQLFSARTALGALAAAREKPLTERASASPVRRPQVTVLYNPELKTSYIMIPALCA